MLRRDFTVNALAMDKDGHIYDYTGGQKDIRKKRLVTVGDARRRFQEDALRLFRACRFTGQLDFLPDKELIQAMPEAFHRVAGLSVERVVGEIDRLMTTPAAYKGLDVLVRTGLGAAAAGAGKTACIRTCPSCRSAAICRRLPSRVPFTCSTPGFIP